MLDQRLAIVAPVNRSVRIRIVLVSPSVDYCLRRVVGSDVQVDRARTAGDPPSALGPGSIAHDKETPLAKKIGARGRAPHRSGHNLLIRLHKFKRDVLRFLYDFAVPFTNNEAERDLRMMKVKMKISGGFRTMAGARTFARLRAVISTGRKQGWNILQTLTANPNTLTHALSP